LAVGLEDEIHGVWILFAAVAAHKYVISYCVGMELYNARTRVALHLAYITMYAVLSPIGIGIGLAVSRIGTGPTLYVTSGVLQALAGGTIIYVVVFEILERERSKKVSGLAQLFFVILGFSAMLIIELVAPHEHGEHDHEHEEQLLSNMTTLSSIIFSQHQISAFLTPHMSLPALPQLLSLLPSGSIHSFSSPPFQPQSPSLIPHFFWVPELLQFSSLVCLYPFPSQHHFLLVYFHGNNHWAICLTQNESEEANEKKRKKFDHLLVMEERQSGNRPRICACIKSIDCLVQNSEFFFFGMWLCSLFCSFFFRKLTMETRSFPVIKKLCHIHLTKK